MAVSNTDRVMALLRQRPGLTDREIRETTGIEPHQQINQITNRLTGQGRIRRVREAGLLRNYPQGDPAPATADPTARPAHPRAIADVHRRPEPPSGNWRVEPLTVGRPLVVLPCSASKARGGQHADGDSVLNLLPPGLAAELADARSRRADSREEERNLLPAWRRYTGHLYREAASVWGLLQQHAVPIAIVSGGYGLVLASEPIAWYEARFRPGDWPGQLVSRSLAALAGALEADRVIALAGASTPYARVMRQARWAVPTTLLTPQAGTGGAMRTTPRVLGQALADLASHKPLDEHWHVDGVALNYEQLH